ncbi:MAG: RidA family protein [Planctomycetes bacterium]|nr:RidA family protein [Planctomycetota bacterium]
MTKSIISTSHAPVAIGPYSQAVLTNGWLFVSGQIPIDPATDKIISDNISKQTEQVLNNLKAIVEKAGGTMQNIVKTTVYIKDINEFTAMNEVYKQYFTHDPPARATVEVARLPKDVKIEIDAIAVIPPR